MLENWITESLNRTNRKKAEIYYTLHILKDKNLTLGEKAICEHAVRHGAISKKYSRNAKICFKTYNKSRNKTYFVMTSVQEDFIRIITLFHKKGKH